MSWDPLWQQLQPGGVRWAGEVQWAALHILRGWARVVPVINNHEGVPLSKTLLLKLIVRKTIYSGWWLWYDDYHLRLRNCRAAKNSKDCDEPAHSHLLLALFIFPNCLRVKIFSNIKLSSSFSTAWTAQYFYNVPFLCRRCLPIMAFILVT